MVDVAIRIESKADVTRSALGSRYPKSRIIMVRLRLQGSGETPRLNLRGQSVLRWRLND
jgi:hypothetical protein